MIKRLALGIFLLSALPLFANLSAVNLDNLPKDGPFQAELQAFIQNSGYMSHFSPEWNYPIAKDDLVAQASAFESLLESRAGDNYDLELLRLITLRYLYNLDAQGIAERLEEKAAYLKAAYPADYRTSWIYGNYLVSSTRIVRGMEEFRSVLGARAVLEAMPPAFLEDYAYACLLASMFKNGMVALETASRLRGKALSDYWLYKPLQGMLRQPLPDEDYPKEQTWFLQKTQGAIRLSSHILGVALPVQGDWSLKILGLSKRQSFVLVSPPKLVSTLGKSIGINVLFQFSLADQSYADFVNAVKATLPVLREETRRINGNLFQVFYYEDLSKYPNLGGSRGCYVTTQILPGKFSNCAVEVPFELDHKAGGAAGKAYYALDKGYDRIDHPVNVGILLDSCNEVFAQSEAFFWALLGEAILE